MSSSKSPSVFAGRASNDTRHIQATPKLKRVFTVRLIDTILCSKFTHWKYKNNQIQMFCLNVKRVISQLHSWREKLSLMEVERQEQLFFLTVNWIIHVIRMQHSRPWKISTTLRQVPWYTYMSRYPSFLPFINDISFFINDIFCPFLLISVFLPLLFRTQGYQLPIYSTTFSYTYLNIFNTIQVWFVKNLIIA